MDNYRNRLIESIIDGCNKRTKPKYYVSKVTGNKYPYYHPQWTTHPTGTKRYSNIGNSRSEPTCYDLPKDEYPYEIEYEEPKLPIWFNN